MKTSHCILVLVPINPRSPRSTLEQGYLMKERERNKVLSTFYLMSMVDREREREERGTRNENLLLKPRSTLYIE